MNVSEIGCMVQKGVSVFCATCARFWEGRARELPFPKCTVVERCGSPLAGLDFPQYSGPISDSSAWCFVCGSTPEKLVRINGSRRVFGLCAEHVEMLSNVVPVNQVRVQQVYAIRKDGKCEGIDSQGESLFRKIAELDFALRNKKS